MLHEENLKNILTNPTAANKPIIIISIVGAFRTGKSFLLNTFLQYLKSNQITRWTCVNTNNTNNSFKLAENNNTSSNILNKEKNSGFSWSYGSNSHTKGFNIRF